MQRIGLITEGKYFKRHFFFYMLNNNTTCSINVLIDTEPMKKDYLMPFHSSLMDIINITQ